MVANKHTKKEVISFCSEVSDLLSNLKINETNKENIKKYEKLNKQSEKCKDLINRTKPVKGDKKKTNYNNYIKDCFLIKKGEKTSGILPKNIEKEINTDINNNENNNYLSIFGNFWKNKIDDEIKNKYKNIKEENKSSSENVKHKGRPKKIINE